MKIELCLRYLHNRFRQIKLCIQVEWLYFFSVLAVWENFALCDLRIILKQCFVLMRSI